MTPQAMARLHAAAFHDTRAWTAEEFAALLEAKGTFAIGDDTSFALVRVTLDEAELLTLATDPAYRRKGLAFERLRFAAERAVALGAKTMFLEVAEDNAPAIALYGALGFAQVGKRPNYYLPKDRAAVAALVLRKGLLAN